MRTPVARNAHERKPHKICWTQGQKAEGAHVAGLLRRSADGAARERPRARKTLAFDLGAIYCFEIDREKKIRLSYPRPRGQHVWARVRNTYRLFPSWSIRTKKGVSKEAQPTVDGRRFRDSILHFTERWTTKGHLGGARSSSPPLCCPPSRIKTFRQSRTPRGRCG